MTTIHPFFEGLENRHFAAAASEPFTRPDEFAILISHPTGRPSPKFIHGDLHKSATSLLPEPGKNLVGIQTTFVTGATNSTETIDHVFWDDPELYTEEMFQAYGHEYTTNPEKESSAQLCRKVALRCAAARGLTNLGTYALFADEHDELTSYFAAPTSYISDFATEFSGLVMGQASTYQKTIHDLQKMGLPTGAIESLAEELDSLANEDSNSLRELGENVPAINSAIMLKDTITLEYIREINRKFTPIERITTLAATLIRWPHETAAVLGVDLALPEALPKPAPTARTAGKGKKHKPGRAGSEPRKQKMATVLAMNLRENGS